MTVIRIALTRKFTDRNYKNFCLSPFRKDLIGLKGFFFFFICFLGVGVSIFQYPRKFSACDNQANSERRIKMKKERKKNESFSLEEEQVEGQRDVQKAILKTLLIDILL